MSEEMGWQITDFIPLEPYGFYLEQCVVHTVGNLIPDTVRASAYLAG